MKYRQIYFVNSDMKYRQIYFVNFDIIISWKLLLIQKNFQRGHWSHSGLSAHKQLSDKPIDWDNPKVLYTLTEKNKALHQYDLRLRESLHIAKENCGPGFGLNEDWGGHLFTRVWHPLFQKMQ